MRHYIISDAHDGDIATLRTQRCPSTLSRARTHNRHRTRCNARQTTFTHILRQIPTLRLSRARQRRQHTRNPHSMAPIHHSWHTHIPLPPSSSVCPRCCPWLCNDQRRNLIQIDTLISNIEYANINTIYIDLYSVIDCINILLFIYTHINPLLHYTSAAPSYGTPAAPLHAFTPARSHQAPAHAYSTSPPKTGGVAVRLMVMLCTGK